MVFGYAAIVNSLLKLLGIILSVDLFVFFVEILSGLYYTDT